MEKTEKELKNQLSEELKEMVEKLSIEELSELVRCWGKAGPGIRAALLIAGQIEGPDLKGCTVKGGPMAIVIKVASMEEEVVGHAKNICITAENPLFAGLLDLKIQALGGDKMAEKLYEKTKAAVKDTFDTPEGSKE